MRRYTYTKIRDCNSARDRLPAYGRLGESQLKGLGEIPKTMVYRR